MGLSSSDICCSIASTSAFKVSIMATSPRVMRPRACPSAPSRPGAASVTRSKSTAVETPPE